MTKRIVEITAVVRCPCLSGLLYDECCGPLHRGEKSAATAEQLMRSRYSAFAVGDAHYLLATWHLSTRPATLTIEPGIRWFRLDILRRERGGLLDTDGVVEFEAHYRPSDSSGARGGSQREASAFVRESGSWYYVAAHE